MTYDDISIIIGVLEDRLVSLKGKSGTEYLQHRLQTIISKLKLSTVDVRKIPVLTEPAYPAPQPSTPGWFGNCPTCGLKLNQVMGYCCPNPGCPTGLGPVTC